MTNWLNSKEIGARLAVATLARLNAGLKAWLQEKEAAVAAAGGADAFEREQAEMAEAEKEAEMAAEQADSFGYFSISSDREVAS